MVVNPLIFENDRNKSLSNSLFLLFLLHCIYRDLVSSVTVLLILLISIRFCIFCSDPIKALMLDDDSMY